MKIFLCHRIKMGDMLATCVGSSIYSLGSLLVYDEYNIT